MNRKRFGRSSEQSRYDDCSEQLSMEMLLNETEVISAIAPTPAEPDLTSLKDHTQKKHATNDEKLPETAEIEVVAWKLSEEERICPVCREKMREIGEDVTRKLTIVPAKVVIVEMYRKGYACRNCEQTGISTPVRTVPAESEFLPGSMCLPEAVT